MTTTTRPLYTVPVTRRAEATARQFAVALVTPTALVTFKQSRYHDEETIELELIGMGDQLASAYGPCLVGRRPGKRYELALIPLTMLVRIDPNPEVTR